jgi:Na+/H+ antiporter NhaD/arsenite permease-like protein
LILFISLAYMAITLDVTGILQAAAFWVSNKGGSNGRKLYFYFYLLLTLVSMVVGNDPVILSGTAFLVYYTAATGLEPVAWLISEFAAANTASMVLFVGNPTNVVICEGFAVNNAAFTAYTILPFLACSAACYVALMFQFRDAKHVPPKLSRTGKLDVLSVLHDPVSAIFGSILLLICLIVIIALSFFHVDVWKVVLPFAVAKFIFDLCWDHYRYKKGPVVQETHKTTSEDPMNAALVRAMSMPSDIERSGTTSSLTITPNANAEAPTPERSSSTLHNDNKSRDHFPSQRTRFNSAYKSLSAHFPTFMTALPRLPFALIPFAFSQFILIEALSHQGWIDVFAHWLVKATHGQTTPTIWIIGILGVIMCNLSGTNIGATILLTKVVRAADLSSQSTRAAAIALAVASNIGAVSFTFSASLAGLLWKSILMQKEIKMKQRTFAFWNMLPLLAMTGVGLAIVTAEMAVLY